MKNIIILLSFLFFTGNIHAGYGYLNKIEKTRKKDNTVYVCDGPKAYAFHKNPNCSGLSKCSQQVLKVSENDAINKYKRRACRKCY